MFTFAQTLISLGPSIKSNIHWSLASGKFQAELFIGSIAQTDSFA